MTISQVLIALGVLCFVLAAFAVTLGPAGPLSLIAVGLALVNLAKLVH